VSCICDIDTLCEIDADASQLFERAGLKLSLPADHEFLPVERRRWLDSLAVAPSAQQTNPQNLFWCRKQDIFCAVRRILNSF
jgi:hypothetical protein